MKDNKFEAREVAVLIEDLKGEFRSVSEVVIPLREDMAEVKDRLTSLEGEVRSLLKDVVRIAVPDLSKRVVRLEEKAGF